MLAFGKFVIRFRVLILVLVAGLTGFFGYQALNLKVNSDIVTYLPPDKEAVHLFKKVGNTFGGNSMIMVALETDADSMFTHEGLTLIRSIAQACEQTKGVQNTVSIANILDVRKIEGGIEVKKLVPQDEVPTDPAVLAEIKDRALSKDMYSGKLVSHDGKLAMVLLRLAEGVDRGVLAFELRNTVNDVVAKHQAEAKAHYSAYFGGLPIWTAALSEIILHDITFLIPIVAIVLILILFVSFRTIRGVVLPLLNVGVAVIWVMGLMALLDMKLTMISDVIPVLLMAVGSAYGIHFINAFNEDLEPGEDPKQRLPKVTARIGIPILMAALTTFAGFISFVTSYLSLFQEFGILTAIGVAAAFLLALTMVPAILSFLPAKKQAVSEGPDLPIMQKLLTRIGSSAASHRWAWGIAFIVISGLMVWGTTLITRSVNLSAYFQDDHYIRQSDKVLDKHFGGVAPIQILVRGDIKDPFVLKQMLEIEKFLDSLPRVTGSNSIASLLAEINEQLNGRYAIPDSPEGVGNLFTFIEGDDILERMVYPTGSDRPSMALVQAFMSTGDSALLVSTSALVREYLAKNTYSNWEVVMVAGPEKFGASVSDVQKGRIARAAKLMRYDVTKRLPDELIESAPDLEPILHEVLEASPGSDPSVAKDLVRVMMEYVTGDESLVTVSEDAEKAKLEAELTRLVGGPVTYDTLFAALKGGLKPETVEEDVESVQDTARSLLRRYEEHVQSVLVDRVVVRVTAMLPTDLAGNAWLQRDLRGDLWELMDGYFARPIEDAAATETTPIARIVTQAQLLDPKNLGGFGVTSAYTVDPESILLESLLTPIPYKELADPESVATALKTQGPQAVPGVPPEAKEQVGAAFVELLGEDRLTQFRVARVLREAAPSLTEQEAWTQAGPVVALYDSLVRSQREAWAKRMVESRLTQGVGTPQDAIGQFVAALEQSRSEVPLRNRSAFAATGMPRVYEEMDNNLISSQLQSLLIALGLTLLLLTIQFKSIVAGLISLVPILFTVASEFGLMAFASVPLDTATVLIASLAVGIGIDYTIHFMARVKLEARNTASTHEAIVRTSRTTGVAIVINAISVAAGFVVLVVANLVPLQNFGWMTATTMIISGLAALTLLPLMLSMGKGARFLRRTESGKDMAP